MKEDEEDENDFEYIPFDKQEHPCLEWILIKYLQLFVLIFLYSIGSVFYEYVIKDYFK